MFRFLLLSLLFVFDLHSLPGQSASISPRALAYLDSHDKVPILIYLKKQANLSAVKPEWTKLQKGTFVYQALQECSSSSQSRIIDFLELNQVAYKSFFIVNCVQAYLHADQLNHLSQMSEVAALLFDESVQLTPVMDKTLLQIHARAPEITWGIKSIHADEVWDLGYEGQGVTVAGEDTGIKWDIPAIKDKYRGWNDTSSSVDHNYNWHDAIHTISPLSGDSINPCGLNLLAPCDDHGHGTHTIGTITGHSSEHAIGVAPKSKWIGCRNMERGNGAPSTYIECFEFFLAPTDLEQRKPRIDLAPAVINNSWYCSEEEGCDPSNWNIMERVVSTLKAAGIVVVASAGNNGNTCGTIANPISMFESAFSVGSYASNDTISGFSSCGPVVVDSSLRIKPNIVAPGSEVISQLPDLSYQAWSGTSMAGPHVAGVVALMISANPSLLGQVEKIESILEQTAEPTPSLITCAGSAPEDIPNIMYGYGKINALRAVLKAKSLVGNEDKTFKSWQVVPNPGKELISLNMPVAEDVLLIYNLLGQLVLSTPISAQDGILPDFTGLNSGLYHLILQKSGYQTSWVKQ